MGVRSSRLAGPSVVTGTGTTTVLTVESGETWLVKWVTLANDAGSGHEIQLYVGSNAIGNQLFRETVPATSCIQREVWWVLGPGEALTAKGGSGQSTTITVHGAELEGVAD